MSFLAHEGFDFNKWVRQGVSYLPLKQYEQRVYQVGFPYCICSSGKGRGEARDPRTLQLRWVHRRPPSSSPAALQHCSLSHSASVVAACVGGSAAVHVTAER